MARAGVAGKQVDEVIMGNVLSAGLGQNPARQAAIAAGLPHEVSALTINKVCGSGLKAVHLATQAILAGDADIVVAGGFENMSQAPYVLKMHEKASAWGSKVIDTMIHDGLWCAFNDYHMGVTAENLCDAYEISREEQDAFAARSQQRAEAAMAAGKFNEEIVAVEIPQRKGDPLIFDKDEFPRQGVTAESLSKLRPAFKRMAL